MSNFRGSKNLLRAARLLSDRQSESRAIGLQGRALAHLGDARKAIELIEQALLISRNVGDRLWESIHLNNLGRVRYVQGDSRKALELFGQALAISRNIGN